MPSRRRSRSKNLGTNLADVQRRMRYLERRPNRTKLQTKVVKAIHITPETITTNEVAFGTTVVTTVEPTENLKEGVVWVNPDDGVTNVYSADINDFVTITDANAVEALTIAQGKNKTYVQPAEPTGDTYYEGDLWIDTDDGNKLYVYSGTGWVSRQDTAISAAQTTANGKNTVYYSTSVPGSTVNIAGDIWWKYGFTRAISNKALTSNIATLTTSSAHGLSVGAQVKISGINSTFNGTYTVDSIPTTTTFTYAKTAANVASSAVSPTGTLLYSDEIITGQWVGAGGTTWTPNTIGNLVIANIDAGKITTGYLDVSGAVRITTSATASGTGGNTSRIELNSNGFYAYNGSVATVSITNTGTAVFSGTVNATGGTFTGYVTAGTARFGAAVQTGKNGIYINANNYWYDDGTFKTGTGTSSITYDETGALTIGAGTAIAGITASVLAAGASEGATALQPGNGVLDNGSDQIVSISTASGIVIGTDPSKSLNEARVELRASGFYAYDGDEPTVSILANGDAEFKGTVKAGSLIIGADAEDVVSGASDGSTAIQAGNGVDYDLDKQIIRISTAEGIKIGTAPNASGTTARVELNSSGFYAYNGEVSTVKILSNGDAEFTGTVTVGSLIGDTDVETVLDGASDGSTALQDGNGVEQNLAKQITKISTASGIVIGTRVDATGARVEMNSGGFYAYNGTDTEPTVKILNTGAATFKGTVTAGSLIVGTDASTLVSNAAQGETALQPGNGVGDNGSDQITSISTQYGIIIGTRVDSTGSRVEMNSGGFFAYDASGETVAITSAGVARFKGSVTGSSFTSTNYASGDGVAITSPSAGIDQILFNKGGQQVSSYSVVAGGVVIQTGTSQLTMTTGGATLLTSESKQLSMGSTLYLLGGSGVRATTGNIRNIHSSTGDPSGGGEGDVWLKYE